MKAFGRFSILLSLLGILLFITGCPFSTEGGGPDPIDPPEVEDFKPRTSPENLLHNLKQAYEFRNIIQYDSLIAENFLFYFSEDDQQSFPDPYDWQAEHDSHERMFDPEWVQDLELEFHVGAVEIDTLRTSEGDTLWVTTVDQVELYLFGSNPQHPNDDPQGWRLQDGIQKYWFQKQTWTDASTGANIWKIIEWREIDN